MINYFSETGGEETRPRNVAMLYCINATAEPSSGGGQQVLQIYYLCLMTGIIEADGTITTGSGFTCVNEGTGQYILLLILLEILLII